MSSAMRRFSSLRLNALRSKIHPPLLLTPQDAEKLQGLIIKSFRKQLHREDSRSSAGPVDTHIRSILSNPLLTAPSREVQSSLAAPMDYFQWQIARGRASLATARHCLKAELLNCTRFQDVKLASGRPSDTKAGTIMLQWLRSSGFEDSLEHVYDRGLMKLLIPFLFREGKHNQVLTWLEKTAALPKRSRTELEGKYGKDTASAMAYVLWRFIRTIVQQTVDYGSATSFFLEAAQRTRHLPPSEVSASLRSGHYLMIQFLWHQMPPKLDAQTYEKFARSSPNWSRDTPFTSAALALSHPTHPDPFPTLQFISVMPDLRIRKQTSPTYRRAIMLLCLKCANTLVARDSYAHAETVMDFLKINFADELGHIIETEDVDTAAGLQSTTSQYYQSDGARNVQYFKFSVAGPR